MNEIVYAIMAMLATVFGRGFVEAPDADYGVLYVVPAAREDVAA